jgi:hypothetical protein
MKSGFNRKCRPELSRHYSALSATAAPAGRLNEDALDRSFRSHCGDVALVMPLGWNET